MADVLDPATMDALDKLGEEIAAQTGTEAAPEPLAPEPQAEGQIEPETVLEAPEGQQEGEGEPEVVAEGETPKPKPTRAQKDKDVQRLLRDRYEARNKAAEAEAKAAELERQIAELKAAQTRPADPPPTGQAPAPPVIQRQGETGQDFEARVQAESSRRAKEATFNDACNRVATKGAELHKDFGEAQGALMGAFGRQVNMRPEFLQAIVRLDNGHDVFHHLGTNLEAAEALFAHADPVDLVMAMGELSAKLKTPKTQKISAAPAPVNPIRGGANSNRASVRLDDDKTPMDEWSKQFLKELAS